MFVGLGDGQHEKQSARARLKQWESHLDDAGHRTLFQVELRKLLGNEEANSIEQSITSLEEALYHAGRIGGKKVKVNPVGQPHWGQMQPNQM